MPWSSFLPPSWFVLSLSFPHSCRGVNKAFWGGGGASYRFRMKNSVLKMTGSTLKFRKNLGLWLLYLTNSHVFCSPPCKPNFSFGECTANKCTANQCIADQCTADQCSMHRKLSLGQSYNARKVISEVYAFFYCSVQSYSGKENTRRMSQPDMESIFIKNNLWNILVIGNHRE